MIRRVLIVAPYFAPHRRVGAQRPTRFARHLPALGWSPGIVQLAGGGEPTEAERVLLEGLPRHLVRPPFDRTQTPGRSAETSAPRRPSPLDAIDRAIPVDGWLPALFLAAPGALRFARRFDPAVVLSTADPWSSHLLGGWLARKLRVPHVADFRDPWTLCQVRGKDRPRLTRTIDEAVERSILGRAAQIVFTAEATARAYREAFPERAGAIEVIENAFEGAPRSPAPDPASDLLELSFLGRFRPLSSARRIIEALAGLDPEERARVRVRSVGGLDARDARRAEALEVGGCFTPLDPVPPERVRGLASSSDVLLLSVEPGRDQIIPAKLFDALAAGRPILSLGDGPDVARILEATRTGVQVDGPEVTEILRACLAARREGRPLPLRFDPDREAIAYYSAEATVARLADVLHRATTSPRRRSAPS